MDSHIDPEIEPIAVQNLIARPLPVHLASDLARHYYQLPPSVAVDEITMHLAAFTLAHPEPCSLDLRPTTALGKAAYVRTLRLKLAIADTLGQ